MSYNPHSTFSWRGQVYSAYDPFNKEKSVKMPIVLGPIIPMPIYNDFSLDEDGGLNDHSSNDTSWIQTYTGKKFYPLNPLPEDISIEDIAHSLSMQCRFTGHSPIHYSIAQHSVLVSYLCDKADRLQGLLHDGSEYAISDISSPIKRLPGLQGYRDIEDNIQRAIYRKFGVAETMSESVKEADMLMLGIEAQSLMKPLADNWHVAVDRVPVVIQEMSPAQAKKLFLERFNELYVK